MPKLGIESVGHIRKDSTTTEVSKLSFIPKYCKLPAHIHHKVSVVDRFRFWFSSSNSFQGAKSIVMQTSVIFGPYFGRGEGTEVSEGHPL